MLENNPIDQIDIMQISKATDGQGTIFNNHYKNAALHKTPDIVSSTRIVFLVDILNAVSLDIIKYKVK